MCIQVQVTDGDGRLTDVGSAISGRYHLYKSVTTVRHRSSFHPLGKSTFIGSASFSANKTFFAAFFCDFSDMTELVASNS